MNIFVILLFCSFLMLPGPGFVLFFMLPGPFIGANMSLFLQRGILSGRQFNILGPGGCTKYLKFRIGLKVLKLVVK